MKIKTHSFLRNLLLSLFVLYNAQGVFYPVGTFISQLCLFLIILISSYYLIKNWASKEKKKNFLIAWTLLLIVNVLGFIITANFDHNHVSMFKNTLICSLTFYPFFYYGRHDFIKANHFLWFLYSMLLVTVLQFYSTTASLMEEQNRENVVNNVAYMFVLLIPFVFLIRKNKLLSIATLGIISLFIILGNKRGALITAAVGVIFYAFYQLRTVEKHNRVKGYTLFFIFFTVLGYFIYQFFESNEFLINRMIQLSEGNTSYRTANYTAIINTWVNSGNFLNIFFGFGFASSIQITGIHFAHNDWLELLSNFGLLGVFVYLLIFVSALSYLRRNRWEINKKILLLTILAMWFMTSLYSMWYTSLGASLNVMLLGYLFGSKKKDIA